MNKNLLVVLTVALLLLVGSFLLFAANATLRIDDSGKVIDTDQHHHAKNGDNITWARQTGAGKPWFVKFATDSPCTQGGVFASAGAKRCTIKVACSKTGDPGCKAYKYSSATGPNAPLNDPDIIVDP